MVILVMKGMTDVIVGADVGALVGEEYVTELKALIATAVDVTEDNEVVCNDVTNVPSLVTVDKRLVSSTYASAALTAPTLVTTADMFQVTEVVVAKLLIGTEVKLVRLVISSGDMSFIKLLLLVEVVVELM